MNSFDSELWEKLSDAERVAYCREAAREAEAHARTAGSDVVHLYISLAEQWRVLECEIELRMKRNLQ